MLLARTPMKPAGDVCEDVPKPVKWLRCLQCNQKFPEDRFREHQRESKSPCELVRPPPSTADARTRGDPGGIASARVGRARGRLVGVRACSISGHAFPPPTHRASRAPRAEAAPSVRSSETRPPRGSGVRSDTWRIARSRARASRTARFSSRTPARATRRRCARAARRVSPKESASLTTPVPAASARFASPGFSADRHRSVVQVKCGVCRGALAARAEGGAREGVPRPRRVPEGGGRRRRGRRRARAATKQVRSSRRSARAPRSKAGGGGEARIGLRRGWQKTGCTLSRARPSPRRTPVPTRDDSWVSPMPTYAVAIISARTAVRPGAPRPRTRASARARPAGGEPRAGGAARAGAGSKHPSGPSGANPGGLDDSDAGLDLRARLQKHELMATIKPNANKVYIGDRAEVGGRRGTVMFVGPAEFGGGRGGRHAPGREARHQRVRREVRRRASVPVQARVRDLRPGGGREEGGGGEG